MSRIEEFGHSSRGGSGRGKSGIADSLHRLTHSQPGVVTALAKFAQLQTLHVMSQAARGVDAAFAWCHELATMFVLSSTRAAGADRDPQASESSSNRLQEQSLDRRTTLLDVCRLYRTSRHEIGQLQLAILARSAPHRQDLILAPRKLTVALSKRQTYAKQCSAVYVGNRDLETCYYR